MRTTMFPLSTLSTRRCCWCWSHCKSVHSFWVRLETVFGLTSVNKQLGYLFQIPVNSVKIWLFVNIGNEHAWVCVCGYEVHVTGRMLHRRKEWGWSIDWNWYVNELKSELEVEMGYACSGVGTKDNPWVSNRIMTLGTFICIIENYLNTHVRLTSICQL